MTSRLEHNLTVLERLSKRQLNPEQMKRLSQLAWVGASMAYERQNVDLGNAYLGLWQHDLDEIPFQPEMPVADIPPSRIA